MTEPLTRRLTRLRLDDNGNVWFRFLGRSEMVMARALEIRNDHDGLITGMLLDRRIHTDLETHFECEDPCISGKTVEVSGCYVTELSVVPLENPSHRI